MSVRSTSPYPSCRAIFEVRDQARHLLEQPPPQASPQPLYQRELASFDLRDVRVQPDALVLVMDFRLVVK